MYLHTVFAYSIKIYKCEPDQHEIGYSVGYLATLILYIHALCFTTDFQHTHEVIKFLCPILKTLEKIIVIIATGCSNTLP